MPFSGWSGGTEVNGFASAAVAVPTEVVVGLHGSQALPRADGMPTRPAARVANATRATRRVFALGLFGMRLFGMRLFVVRLFVMRREGDTRKVPSSGEMGVKSGRARSE
jgi:hypothetical protein